MIDQAVAAALKTDIPAVVGLLNMGLELNVNLEDLTSKAEIPSWIVKTCEHGSRWMKEKQPFQFYEKQFNNHVFAQRNY